MRKKGILFLLLFISFIVPIHLKADTVYVCGEVVNIRSGPNTKHQVVRKVKMNEELRRIKRLDDWSRVVLSDGETGWISDQYLSLEKIKSRDRTKKEVEKVYVTGQTVNIRSGPGAKHRVMTKVKRGTELSRIKKADGWSRVKLPDGETGWISEQFITTDASPEADSDEELQFRSFRLGTTKDKIVQQLQDGGYQFQSENTQIHVLIKELFGHECRADFHFTPKSMTLYMIELFWAHMDISERAKHVLVYKYGKPNRMDSRTGDLFWTEGDISVQLDANTDQTRVFYTHAPLLKLCEEEGNI